MPKYLRGYPPELLAQVQGLIDNRQLASTLAQRHPEAHTVRSERALYDYVSDMKARHMKGAPPLAKVTYDAKLHVLNNVLGSHTRVSRVQGGQLKAKREIRVASLFKHVPEDFLKMITVHELAHLKERAHDKAFYSLCNYMEPRYHQLEFELRVYLTHLEAAGTRLWGTADPT